MSAQPVGEVFADAITLAIEKERDDVFQRLLDGVAEIMPAIAPPSDSEVVE